MAAIRTSGDSRGGLTKVWGSPAQGLVFSFRGLLGCQRAATDPVHFLAAHGVSARDSGRSGISWRTYFRALGSPAQSGSLRFFYLHVKNNPQAL
jgi:hypothetical protein